MRITFRDNNPAVVNSYADYLERTPFIIQKGDIFHSPAGIIVSPANSFGFMDGGVDDVIAKRLPLAAEKVRREVLTHGIVPVGQSRLFSTRDKDFPMLLMLPTMLGPMGIEGTLNVFYAAYELFQAASRAKCEIVCPGLGTGCGAMPPAQSAHQILWAWELFNRPESVKDCRQAHHFAVDLTL
jgi:O-acetyl-ADP-ribose deacetylase (regulator of RNase III)